MSQENKKSLTKLLEEYRKGRANKSLALELYLKEIEIKVNSIGTTRDDLNKAVLFTSLPILGVTVAFFSTRPAEHNILYLSILHLGSVCLIGAVFSVIISYWTHWIGLIFSIMKLGASWKNEYSEEDDEFTKEEESDRFADRFLGTTLILCITSTALYILGITLIAVFFYLNL